MRRREGGREGRCVRRGRGGRKRKYATFTLIYSDKSPRAWNYRLPLLAQGLFHDMVYKYIFFKS